MRHLLLICATLSIVACDGAAEAEHGDHGVELHMGLGPRPTAPAALHLAAEDREPGAAAERAPAPAGSLTAPASADADADADATAQAIEAAPSTDTPDDADTAANDDAAGDAAGDTGPPADDSPTPDAAPARSEAEWAEFAKVRLGSAKIAETLDADAVRKVVRAGARDLRRCYAKALVSTPTLTGKLTVDLIVDKRGEVDEAKLKSSSLADAALEACVTSAAQAWSFAAPSDGKNAKIRQAFSLSPS